MMTADTGKAEATRQHRCHHEHTDRSVIYFFSGSLVPTRDLLEAEIASVVDAFSETTLADIMMVGGDGSLMFTEDGDFELVDTPTKFQKVRHIAYVLDQARKTAGVEFYCPEADAAHGSSASQRVSVVDGQVAILNCMSASPEGERLPHAVIVPVRG